MRRTPEGGSLVRGGWAEDLAQRFLQQKGLIALQQNYRCRRGEIDLIMRDQGAIVFVEVRYRRRSGFGSGAESVTKHKQKKLVATAQYFLGSYGGGSSVPCRFDVVSITGSGSSLSLTWIPNAFEASY